MAARLYKKVFRVTGKGSGLQARENIYVGRKVREKLMELLFLGTGAGVPAKLRNVSSLALMLLEERNAVWLFDCGEATQHQIIHTSLKPRKIEKIFITHLHGDHIFGLPGLLGSRSFQGGTTELTIYGPKGIRQFVETALKVSNTHLKYPLVIEEIKRERYLMMISLLLKRYYSIMQFLVTDFVYKKKINRERYKRIV